MACGGGCGRRRGCGYLCHSVLSIMALVFACEGDPSSGLVGLRCSGCKAHKKLSAFPKSCAKWGRGECTDCAHKRWLLRKESRDPVAQKLDSARVRFGGSNGVKRGDIARLYEENGVWGMT